jgi:hypothetical protein
LWKVALVGELLQVCVAFTLRLSVRAGSKRAIRIPKHERRSTGCILKEDGKHGQQRTSAQRAHPLAQDTHRTAKGIPDEIAHVMLTHSPSASKFPDSLEGKILYYVDQIDVIAIHKDRWKKHLLVGK